MNDVFDETSTTSQDDSSDVIIEVLPEVFLTETHPDKTQAINATYGTNNVIHLGGSYVAYVNVEKNTVIVRCMANEELVKLTFKKRDKNDN